MNPEKIQRQLNEKVIVKTPTHQAWLKSQLESQGYFQTAKKQSVRRRFDLLSFMNIKKLIPVVGIAVFAVLVIVFWNPLLQRFGGKPQLTYAQEMLKLTREQYNALSPEERKKLAESIQEGTLEEVWKEAEAAKDLEFYTGKEAENILYQDFIEFLDKTDPAYANHMRHDTRGPDDPRLRTHVFRFTDIRGNRVNIAITSYSSPPEFSSNFADIAPIIYAEATININRYNLTPTKQRSNRTPEQFTPEEVRNIRQNFEKRIQKNLPTMWNEIKSTSSTDFVVENESDAYSANAKSHLIQVEFQERLEKLHRTSEELISTEVMESSMDGGIVPSFTRQGVVMLRYELPDGRMGYVGTTIDLDYPERVVSQLGGYRMK